MEKKVIHILDKLNKAGYDSYIVGGYVRDSLLGKQSFDIDICTSALPKDIIALFNVNKSNYGSVNFKDGKYNVDITTFRKELTYENGRPSRIIYNVSLEEDLKRRDFTINAICMNKSGKIIDYLNGVDDLNNHKIKMIGNTLTKIKEDPLRILRAIRFATILDFTLDDELYQTIKSNSDLVNQISNTKVKAELDKILLSKNYKKGLDLLNKFGIDKIIGLEYKEINYVNDLNGMWAQIKVSDIPFTNNEKSNIIKITEVLNFGSISEQILFDYGLYICTVAGMILNINPKVINKMYSNMPIKNREDIDISSKEIENIVGPGKIVGETYTKLITLILNKKLKNKEKAIKEFLLKE